MIKPWNLIQRNYKLGPEELPLFAARVRKFAMILRGLLAALEPLLSLHGHACPHAEF